MENKDEEYRGLAWDIEEFLIQAENYKRAAAKFKSEFIEDVGSYFVENEMSLPKNEFGEKFMHEWRNNLYYNLEIDEFYEGMVDWYFHYQHGNKHPFLPYEIMENYTPDAEKPIETYEERLAWFMEKLPPNNDEIAKKFAMEGFLEEQEERRLKKAWKNKIKSYAMPMLLDNETLTATAYREIDQITGLYIFTLKEKLYDLESDIEHNKIKDLDKLQEEYEKDKLENPEKYKKEDISELLSSDKWMDLI
jgi:hypothetical protein